MTELNQELATEQSAELATAVPAKTVLDVPFVSDEEPIRNNDFFVWLNGNAQRGNSAPVLDYIHSYLTTLGFDSSVNVVPEGTVRKLENIYQYWQTVTPYYGPETLAELLTLHDVDGPGLYFVQNSKPMRAHYGVASQKLLDMVANAGWVYEVNPDSTYFELIGTRLYAKYQRILGSRYICDVVS